MSTSNDLDTVIYECFNSVPYEKYKKMEPLVGRITNDLEIFEILKKYYSTEKFIEWAFKNMLTSDYLKLKEYIEKNRG